MKKTRIKKKCLICEKEFEVQLSKIGIGKGKFCSKNCFNLNIGKGIKIKCRCGTCGKMLFLLPSRAMKSENKFCSQKCLKKWCSENLIGKKSHHWKGGRIKKRGYIFIRIGGKDKYISEHHLIWKNKHGEIPNNCIIHHLNSNKEDNRIENLCILLRGEHWDKHSTGKLIEPFKKRIIELEREIKLLQSGGSNG